MLEEDLDAETINDIRRKLDLLRGEHLRNKNLAFHLIAPKYK